MCFPIYAPLCVGRASKVKLSCNCKCNLVSVCHVVNFSNILSLILETNPSLQCATKAGHRTSGHPQRSGLMKEKGSVPFNTLQET